MTELDAHETTTVQAAQVAWEDARAGLRVVTRDEGPVVEIALGRDAMGTPTWRRVDTDDPDVVRGRKIEGWKAITVACGFELAQWRQVLRASRRNVDPLNVLYDAFDRPFVYELVLRDWLARGVRPERARRVASRTPR